MTLQRRPIAMLIDVFINRLRKKSEASGGVRLIHTRRGLGYLLYDPEVSR